MPQPIQFYDGIEPRIPRVDTNGYVIISPTSTLSVTGTLAVAGVVGISGTVAINGTVSAQPITSSSVTGGGLTCSVAAVTLAAANANRKSIIITNNGSGSLYIGETSTVASSGANMGLLVPTNGMYSDSGFGVFTGQLFGIYSVTSTSENIAVRDRS